MVWGSLWNPSLILKSLKNILADKTKFRKYSIGFLFALLASILGAIADVVPKPILEENDAGGLNPITMVAIMYLVNGVVFTIITPKKNPVTETGRKNFVILTAIGIAEIIATSIFYFGLKDTSATNAAILGNSDIIFTTIFAAIIFRETIDRREGFPYSLIIIGSVIIPLWIDWVSNDYLISKFVFGDFLILLAGLFYGIEMNIFRYVSDKIDSKRILQVISFVGSIVAVLVIIVLQIDSRLELEHLPIIIISGIFGIGMSVIFLVMAIKYIGAIRTILIFSTTTLFGIIFSFVVLGEEILELHLIAFVMVFLGIVLLRVKIAIE